MCSNTENWGSNASWCIVRAGRYEQKFISQYFLADLRYTVYFLRFCIWIKQKTNKVNVTIGYIMLKRVKITLHSNIVTLQSKNKNNAFKAEVTFTKLKNENNKKAQINRVKRLFWLPHNSPFTVSAIIQIHLLVGLKFDICHIYCLLTTNISAKCIF